MKESMIREKKYHLLVAEIGKELAEQRMAKQFAKCWKSWYGVDCGLLYIASDLRPYLSDKERVEKATGISQKDLYYKLLKLKGVMSVDGDKFKIKRYLDSFLNPQEVALVLFSMLMHNYNGTLPELCVGYYQYPVEYLRHIPLAYCADTLTGELTRMSTLVEFVLAYPEQEVACTRAFRENLLYTLGKEYKVDSSNIQRIPDYLNKASQEAKEQMGSAKAFVDSLGLERSTIRSVYENYRYRTVQEHPLIAPLAKLLKVNKATIVFNQLFNNYLNLLEGGGTWEKRYHQNKILDRLSAESVEVDIEF